MRLRLLRLAPVFLLSALALAETKPTPGFGLYVDFQATSSSTSFIQLWEKGTLSINLKSFSSAGDLVADETFEVELGQERASRGIALAQAADDFDQDCGEKREGRRAVLVIAGEPYGEVRACKGSTSWPAGPKTRKLLEFINDGLPEKYKIR